MSQRLLVYLIKPPFCSVAKPQPCLITFIINIVISVFVVNRRRCQLLNHKSKPNRRLSDNNATGWRQQISVLPSVVLVVIHCSDKNIESKYLLTNTKLSLNILRKKKSDDFTWEACHLCQIETAPRVIWIKRFAWSKVKIMKSNAFQCQDGEWWLRSEYSAKRARRPGR